MNDATLAEPLRKTGNLMDLLNDEAWIRETDADHASEEGTVEAGLGLQLYVELLKNASPEALQRQRWYVQVLSILLPELRGWLESWQLGRSLEVVYMEAQADQQRNAQSRDEEINHAGNFLSAMR